MRKLLWILTAIFLIWMVCVHRNIFDEKKTVRQPLKASALISCKDGSGTGILLDSGYMITAAHVVDANLDGDVTLEERLVDASFFGGPYPFTQQFEVVYSNLKIDFAILKPVITADYQKSILKRIPKMSAGLFNGKPGDEVFTVGATRGDPPLISKGFVGFARGPHHRATCYISQGNSGGGIFNVENQIIGIVSMVYMKMDMAAGEVMVPVPPTGDGPGRMLLGKIMMPMTTEINGVCVYVPITRIRKDLNKKFIGFLLDKPEPVTLLQRLQEPWTYGLIRVGLNLALFFGVLFFLRKELLG